MSDEGAEYVFSFVSFQECYATALVFGFTVQGNQPKPDMASNLLRLDQVSARLFTLVWI